MKIALCQMNPIIGDLEYNKKKIIEGYRKGVDEGADIVIFPELALIGYPPQDLVEKTEFRKAVAETSTQLASLTGKTALLFGTITDDDDKIGTDIHNSAVLCFDGKIQFIQHKTLIPNYDVFDEMRYFDPSNSVDVFDFNGKKIGISICEDIWNDADYWYRRRYVRDPVKELIDNGAEILINISASPYAFGKRENRRKMLSVLTKNENIPLAYVCCVGAQTELIFDGASMCFDIKGNLVKLGKTYGEDFFIFDTDKSYEKITRCEDNFEYEILTSLIYALKDYCVKLGFKKLLVGLSGGLDSAIVTYLAVQAMGKENVHVMLLPSKYSSKGSITDSEKLINNLGITSSNVSIQPAVDKTIDTLMQLFEGNMREITEENLQARIRGLFLMAFSNNNNYLLLTTGNKSEIATGYCTLYGDMCGGLGVIADVYKTDLYKIANHINSGREIIPQEIIDKPPSAELKVNQTDQDTLPPYDLLDKILKMYLEENLEIDEISKIIGDKVLVTKILKLVDMNEFKRRQAAPALRVSSKAFGYGRRYPIVQGWRK